MDGVQKKKNKNDMQIIHTFYHSNHIFKHSHIYIFFITETFIICWKYATEVYMYAKNTITYAKQIGALFRNYYLLIKILLKHTNSDSQFQT